MGYRKIQNLYKNPIMIDMFKYVYVMEKIHGSSSHISFKNNDLHFFSGGADHSQFCLLFDKEKLLDIYHNSSFNGKELIIFGEVYGGKMQGMSHTYGKQLKFIAFEVYYNDKKWMDVPDAESISKKFQQEFVWYEKIENTLDNLNKYRDQPSQQAIRNGCGDDKPAEGIIIRPLQECYDSQGGRWIYKHKRADFCETASRRETFVDHGRVVILTEAQKVADEFVTEMRLNHILDKMQPAPAGMEDTARVIKAMQNDIRIEHQDEIDWRIGKDILAKIASATAKLWKNRVTTIKKN